MNLFTRPMRLLTAVVLEETGDAVVKALLELGVLDFVHLNRLDPTQMEKLSSRPSAISRTMLEDLRSRVEALLRQGHISLPSAQNLDVRRLEKPDMEQYRATLDGLTASLLSIKEEQKQSNQILMGLEEIRRYLDEDKGEYLDLRVGSIPSDKTADLAARISSFGGLLEALGDEGPRQPDAASRCGPGRSDPREVRLDRSERPHPAGEAIAVIRTRLKGGNGARGAKRVRRRPTRSSPPSVRSSFPSGATCASTSSATRSRATSPIPTTRPSSPAGSPSTRVRR